MEVPKRDIENQIKEEQIMESQYEAYLRLIEKKGLITREKGRWKPTLLFKDTMFQVWQQQFKDTDFEQEMDRIIQATLERMLNGESTKVIEHYTKLMAWFWSEQSFYRVTFGVSLTKLANEGP